jgi:hypothetical protein
VPGELDQPGHDPKHDGRRLFDALFAGEVRTLFERSLGQVEADPRRGLRVSLHLAHSNPHLGRLSGLPWELLYWHDRREFLNLSRRTPVVRRVLVPRPLKAPISPPLRVLVATADIQDADRLETRAERGHIAAAWKAIAGTQVDTLRHASVAALREKLREGGYHVLHFAGHGTFDAARGEGALLFEQPGERPRVVGAPLLADVLRDVGDSLHLAVLNACESGRATDADGLDPFAGVALALVMGGLPAAIAMRHDVQVDAAAAFAERLYARLAAGDPVSAAAAEGRLAIHLLDQDSFEWSTPVVLVRTLHDPLDPHGASASAAISVETGPVQGTAPAVREQILDAHRVVADKTEGFVGRRWLFEAFERFRRRHTRGYFILYGDPGFGKSSVAAELVRRQRVVHHFNSRANALSRPEAFLANVCAQVIDACRLDYGGLPPEATRDSRFLSRLLEEAAATRPGEPLTVLVDALDESDLSTLPPGANLLHLPSTLPPGVFFFLTSRHGDWPLRFDCEQEPFDVRADDRHNLDDARAFVESRLARPGTRAYLAAQALDEAAFVETMTALSEGNFMYLHHVLRDLDSGALAGRTLEQLPHGLKGYYQEHWRRMRSRDEHVWFDVQLPVLVALTAIPDPLPFALVCELAGVPDRRRVREALRQWSAFLHVERGGDADGRSEKLYRLYHASFIDFVREQDEIADERVDLKAAQRRIALRLLGKGR